MMARVTVGLIGDGQIGSRHLQSLARLNRDADIHIIDPSEQSLQTASERYAEITPPGTRTSTRLYPSTDYRGLPGTVDVAVIATTADHRMEAIRSLFSHTTVRNLILEKVVFQNPDDFAVAGHMFDINRVKVWVNCPRRYWPGYIALKAHLSRYDRDLTSMTVTGSSWGLCCNCVHFLDLYLFVTGQYRFSLSGDRLAPRVLPSKRQGILELTGALAGSDPSGNTILLQDEGMAGDIPLRVNFENPDLRCTVDETAGTVRISESAESWRELEIPLQSQLQSQLTHRYIEQILTAGACDLPTFAESAAVHRSFLPVLAGHISKVTGREVTSCPIT
jgi:predicted dehydrogenase